VKHIIPGGHYSYDVSEKRIWMSYEYYGLTVENFYKIVNITRGFILYSVDRPYSENTITVSNGCISLSYSGYGEDTDKIQIVLKTPITDVDTLSYQPLLDSNSAYFLDSDGKILEVPV
jgi:hypothetical protein